MTKKTHSRYTTFYKVMLILSTIGTSFGVLGLISVPQIISEFSISPLYGVGLIALSAITLVAVVALILLWQKQREGYLLKIGTYIASIVAYFICLLGAGPYIGWIVSESSAFEGSQLTTQEIEVATGLIHGIFYLALVTAIIINIVFLFLWRAAWKRQIAADK